MIRRRSRYKFDGENGSNVNITLSDRDRRIFQTLDPQYGFVYLPSNWLSALLGVKHGAVVHRYGELSRAPHDYLLRPPFQGFNLNKHDTYSLRSKKPHPREQAPHQLLIDMITASIHIGIRANPSLSISTWRDILSSDPLPASTRLSDNPFHIPLNGSKLVPDGRPLIIHTPKTSRAYLMEIDRSNMPINPRDDTRSSIKRKLTAYKQFMQTRIYESHFGFDNCLILFITTSEPHMDSIMKYVESDIGSCSWLLFTHISDWHLDRYYPKPSGFMLTRPYLRVGYPPLRLDE